MSTRSTISFALIALVALSGCSSNQMPSKNDSNRFAKIAYTSTLADPDNLFRFCNECPPFTAKTIAEQEEIVVPVVQQVIVPEEPPATQSANSVFMINFELNSSALDSINLDKILQISRELSTRSDVTDIEVHGYTDDIASNSFNYRLAMSRAVSVTQALRNSGVRIPIVSFGEGECCFIAENNSEKERALNRRVEVVFLTKSK